MFGFAPSQFDISSFLLFEGVGGTSSFNFKFKLLPKKFKIKFFKNMFFFPFFIIIFFMLLVCLFCFCFMSFVC